MTRQQDELQLELLKEIRDLLQSIYLGLTPPGPAVAVEFYEVINRREVRLQGMEVIKPGSKKLLKVVFKDAAGRVAKVDGAPAWSITDDSHGTLTPAADGMSCIVDFNGSGMGQGKIQVKADSDMTPDAVEELVGEWEYDLVSGKATFVEITAEDYVEPVV